MTLTSGGKRTIRFKGKKVSIKQIPTEEERARKARMKGGFDDSYYDKKHRRLLAQTHICFYCHKPLKPVEFNYTKGSIQMSCDTSGCIGNFAEDINTMDKCYRPIVNVLDKKLCWDFEDNLKFRDLSRLWAGPKRLI